MANKIYQHPNETIQTWRDSGGTNTITLASLGAGAGRQGARRDFGADTARSHRYRWRFFCKHATSPVVGEVIRIYWKSGDANAMDNDDGTGDAAVSAEDKLNNLTLIGTIVVDEAAAVTMSAWGEINISERYGGPVIWNGTADAFSATAADNGFDLEPIPPEIQT